MSRRPRRKRRPRHVMDLILIAVGAALLLFTVAMIIIFLRVGSVPDTLVACVFAALGGECGVMGWIKTTKERQKERQYELQDRRTAAEPSAPVEGIGTPPKAEGPSNGPEDGLTGV